MTDTNLSPSGFGSEERAAMRQRAKGLKAQESAAEALQSVVDKIASLEEPDRTNAERIHAAAADADADADTLSGKAAKARDYGITIVNEDGLARLIAEL